jgi:hypothetical protein
MAQQKVTFVSQFTQHVLLRRPKIETPLVTGGWNTHQQRIEYKFEPSLDSESGKLVGQLTVKRGQDKHTDHNGWLRDGEDEDVERDAVDALMAHREFGQEFWLLGHAPGTLYPRPQEFRRELQLAVAALDEDKLVEMLTKERGSHARQELIGEVESAVAIVRDLIAQSAAEAEASAKKPAAKKAAATA